MVLRTTRRDQIADSRDGWIHGQSPTKSGGKRKTVASAALTANATKTLPTRRVDEMFKGGRSAVALCIRMDP